MTPSPLASEGVPKWRQLTDRPNSSLHLSVAQQWNMTGSFTFDSYSFQTMTVLRTKITQTMTDYGNWEMFLTSWMTPTQNITLLLNIWL
jgi:hypothetical protein